MNKKTPDWYYNLYSTYGKRKNRVSSVFQTGGGRNTDTADIKHFIGASIASNQRKIILNWFMQNIKDEVHSRNELLDKFRTTFTQTTPKLLKLIELDFYNISDNDFMSHLEILAKAGKISFRKNQPVFHARKS